MNEEIDYIMEAFKFYVGQGYSARSAWDRALQSYVEAFEIRMGTWPEPEDRDAKRESDRRQAASGTAE